LQAGIVFFFYLVALFQMCETDETSWCSHAFQPICRNVCNWFCCIKHTN